MENARTRDEAFALWLIDGKVFMLSFSSSVVKLKIFFFFCLHRCCFYGVYLRDLRGRIKRLAYYIYYNGVFDGV